MDYKKLYEEALERAKKAGVALQIFPEAKKVEDERIREHLIEIVETYWGKTNEPGKAKDLEWINNRKPAVTTLEPIKKDSEVIGVNIPVINKSLLFADISEKELKWEEAKEYAKKLGKELPTKNELYILQFFREEITKYFPRFKNLDIWSQTESQSPSLSAWYVNSYGPIYRYSKYFGCTAVPLAADLITSD